MGLLYQDGLGVSQSHVLAMDYFQRAASMDAGEAFYSIGNVYKNGYGDKKVDYEEAIKWFKSAADLECEEGQLSLGKIYMDGLGVDVNYGVALYWFKKALVRASEEAQALIDRVASLQAQLPQIIQDTNNSKHTAGLKKKAQEAEMSAQEGRLDEHTLVNARHKSQNYSSENLMEKAISSGTDKAATESLPYSDNFSISTLTPSTASLKDDVHDNKKKEKEPRKIFHIDPPPQKTRRSQSNFCMSRIIQRVLAMNT